MSPVLQIIRRVLYSGIGIHLEGDGSHIRKYPAFIFILLGSRVPPLYFQVPHPFTVDHETPCSVLI